MRGINVDQLKTFADVVELGTFSAAAERANLTQPAVSLQIQQLEKRLGVRLIERIGKRAMPTAAGSELLAHARLIDAAVSAALDAMAPHASGRLGRVRLGTGATACIYLLPPILRELRRRAPALEIVVSTGNTVDVLKAIDENRIDIGLVTLPVSGRMFDVTPLVDDEFAVIASASAFPLPATVTPSVLAKLPLVLYEQGGTTRSVVDAWFARAGFSVKPVMELGSVEAIKQLVGAGLGCAVLPRVAITKIDTRPPITARPLSPRLKRKLGLVVRRDKVITRGLREMIRALTTLG
jgi:DNA-binding transcriptional LysR family regulator